MTERANYSIIGTSAYSGRCHDHELEELVQLTTDAQINSQLICDGASSEIGACICA